MTFLEIVTCLNLFLLASPATEVVQLEGARETAQLVSFDSNACVVSINESEKTIPLDSLLSLNFSPNQEPVVEPIRITLRDGSLLSAQGITGTPRKVTLDSQVNQKAAFPTSAVASIRFQPLDEVVGKNWQELTQRNNSDDLVVIRKGDVLDQIKAVIGEIKDQKISLLLGNRDVEVPIEKVFGVIYAEREDQDLETLCQVKLTNGDQIAVKKLKWSEETWNAELAVKGRVVIPTSFVRQIDFSQGKIVYLSDLEPTEVRYQPFFDVTWKYHRDQNGDAQPLSLGNQTFPKGLWIHSKTELTYRLGKKFSSFQATLGIDDHIAQEAASKNKGKVRLTIEGNGMETFSELITPQSAPTELKLEVSGVTNLKITVDYADDLDIADHLILGNARVLK